MGRKDLAEPMANPRLHVGPQAVKEVKQGPNKVADAEAEKVGSEACVKVQVQGRPQARLRRARTGGHSTPWPSKMQGLLHAPLSNLEEPRKQGYMQSVKFAKRAHP